MPRTVAVGDWVVQPASGQRASAEHGFEVSTSDELENEQAILASSRRDRLRALAEALAEHRAQPPDHSRSAKLFAAGIPKMAQKLVEEAAEVAIEAVKGERRLVIEESADLLYNLTVLLVAAEIDPQEVWAEMDRREQMHGLAEKLPKGRAPRE